MTVELGGLQVVGRRRPAAVRRCPFCELDQADEWRRGQRDGAIATGDAEAARRLDEAR